MPYTTLIQANQLAPDDPQTLIFDCRGRLGDPTWGQSAYTESHIPNAFHLDLDNTLALPPDHRGRHPLPDRADWLLTVRDLGVSNDQQIVVYDDAGGAFAARAWWMLRWLGHANVAVLDGGLNAWVQDFSSVVPAPRPVSVFADGPPLTRMIDLAEAADPTTYQLVDARTQIRWAGIEEPIDPIAGHIPGAVCLPFQDNLDTQGRFKSPAALKERFASLANDISNTVVYCGSGVTACHNVLAMRIAGYGEPYLYANSWSGWITDTSRPIATATLQ